MIKNITELLSVLEEVIIQRIGSKVTFLIHLRS